MSQVWEYRMLMPRVLPAAIASICGRSLQPLLLAVPPAFKKRGHDR